MGQVFPLQPSVLLRLWCTVRLKAVEAPFSPSFARLVLDQYGTCRTPQTCLSWKLVERSREAPPPSPYGLYPAMLQNGSHVLGSVDAASQTEKPPTGVYRSVQDTVVNVQLRVDVRASVVLRWGGVLPRLVFLMTTIES